MKSVMSTEKKTEEKMKEANPESIQDKWHNIKKTCLDAAEEIIGRVKHNKKSENEDIKILSETQKKTQR